MQSGQIVEDKIEQNKVIFVCENESSYYLMLKLRLYILNNLLVRIFDLLAEKTLYIKRDNSSFATVAVQRGLF